MVWPPTGTVLPCESNSCATHARTHSHPSLLANSPTRYLTPSRRVRTAQALTVTKNRDVVPATALEVPPPPTTLVAAKAGPGATVTAKGEPTTGVPPPRIASEHEPLCVPHTPGCARVREACVNGCA